MSKQSGIYDALSALDMAHGYVMLRAMPDFQGVSERYATALADKVISVSQSSQARDEMILSMVIGAADEWLVDLWSAGMWQDIREASRVMPLFRNVLMPQSPFTLPVEQPREGAIRLHAKSLVVRGVYGTRPTEESLIAMADVYRQNAVYAIASAIDSLIINGDTEKSAWNINSAGDVPPADAPYLAFDGLRKVALMWRAKARGANDAPSLHLLGMARSIMPHKYGEDVDNLAWIVDGGTYARLVTLSDYQMGQAGLVDGVPITVSAEMPLTMINGMIGASGNTRGQAICVYRPGWIVGYRQLITMAMDYLPHFDVYQMRATMRLALVSLADDATSILCNIRV